MGRTLTPNSSNARQVVVVGQVVVVVVDRVVVVVVDAVDVLFVAEARQAVAVDFQFADLRVTKHAAEPHFALFILH